MKALLEWQLEMGASEAICDTPIDRYSLAEKAPKMAAKKVQPVAKAPEIDRVAMAQQAANSATDLTELNAALTNFGLCDLKKGARNTLFCNGNSAAHIMIVSDPPSRDEDIQGKSFVGVAGNLLDKMLAAIGLSRDATDAAKAVYITSAVPWRTPQNREPTADEMAMLAPFLHRHIQLAAPKILIAMGNTPCQMLLGRRGITRMRGQWGNAQNLPVMPMVHPEYLLRNPTAKREAWMDLLEIKSKHKQ